MIDFNAAELAALEADSISLGIFFYLGTTPAVRLWLGFGQIAPGVNVIDATGQTYEGFGEIRDVPAWRALINGAAERVDFTMNGVSGEVLAIAAADASQVIGKPVAVGFALMAADWSLLGPVHWHANYTAGPLTLKQLVNQDPTMPTVRTLSLSAGSLLTSRKRPGLSYWTDADQQARVPGDLFCSLAAQYTREFALPWPIYT